MKAFFLFGISLLFISCTGTKKTTTENPSTNKRVNSLETQTQEMTGTTDSLHVSNQKTNTETIEEPIPEHDTILYFPEEFNHSTWNNLLLRHVSPNGNVNYNGLMKDRAELLEYIEELGEKIPKSSWAKKDKLAYWINAYNAFTVDLVLRHYPVKSIKDIKKPWKQRYWKLGNKWYNLDEIEHQILRKINEPRIHFAINCASISCPILLNEAYNSEKIYDQLSMVTRKFLADLKKNDLTQDPILLSKIFKWFSKDFNNNTTLIEFLNKYSDETVYSSTQITFKDYNWNLNE